MKSSINTSMSKTFAVSAVVFALTMACSTSNFEGDSAKNKGNKEETKADTGSETPALQSHDQKKGNEQASDVGKSEGSDAAFDNADFKDKEANASETGDATGCALPPEVAARVKGGLGLTTWGGGSGTSPKFMNLDLNNCSWFEAAKADNAYILVHHDKEKQQTYAQRFPGPGNPINWANCLASAALASVSCEFLP